MSKPYTASGVEDLRNHFKNCPTYKDGYIQTSDFAALTKAIDWGISAEKVQALVDLCEECYGGKLKLEDFLRYMQGAHDPILHVRAHAVNFDTNKDGLISAEEYEKILKYFRIVYPSYKFASTSYEDFVAAADVNGDGKVSIDECTTWFQNLHV